MLTRMREHQVSVPMDALLRRFLEETAEREHRTVAGQIRHLVAEAARQQQQQERGGAHQS